MPPAPATDKLVARIFSFSFHRGGPPKDETGHGGGFVFDARSLPNPGREERFKKLTGKDAAVIEYLRQHKSVDEYLKNAEELVDASISKYQSRGFKSLTASFGCTGGQHRSVYLAEQMAKHLRAKVALKSCCVTLNWKRWLAKKWNWRKPADESHGAGCRPGHAAASADQRSP